MIGIWIQSVVIETNSTVGALAVLWDDNAPLLWDNGDEIDWDV